VPGQPLSDIIITFEGPAGPDGGRAKDKIIGCVVKVEITGFSPSYTYARAPDCPVADHQSTCQATIDPPGVSTIVYSIQGDAHGATIDPNTGVITPSTTGSGDITVRAAATVLTSYYDEETFHIRARPIAVSQSTATALLIPVDGKWIHTFSGTGGSLEYAEIHETVIEVNWPFCGGNPITGMSTFLDAGGTMLNYDNLYEPSENFDIQTS
jgi:hypothetical protein